MGGRGAQDVGAPWTTTVTNTAYRKLTDSFNIEVTVAVPRVIQGTVVDTPVPANGTQSVPVTLVVTAAAGALPDHHRHFAEPPCPPPPMYVQRAAPLFSIAFTGTEQFLVQMLL